jgi:hypothetical protein
MRAFLSLYVALALVTLAVSCDPVHDNAVNALGDEDPRVRKGPEHRPGQPCIVCHDGAIGNPRAFSVAGTIYDFDRATGGASTTSPLQFATVVLTDGLGKTWQTAETNSAGNFYVSPTEFTPAYPVQVIVCTQEEDVCLPSTPDGPHKVTMKSLVGRNGSCAGCHTGSPGPSSPGRAYVPPDGVTPP